MFETGNSIPECLKDECYTDTQILWIRGIYVLFTIIWVFIVCFFNLANISKAWIILFIPIILFIIAFFNVEAISCQLNKEVFQTSFIVIGIIFALPLLTWMNKDDSSKFEQISDVVILAIVFTLLSYYHLWVSYEYMIVWKHCRSCFETIAVTLFIYVLITYFVHK